MNERMKVQNLIFLQAWNFPVGKVFSQIMGRDVGKAEKFLKGINIGMLSFCNFEIFPRKVVFQNVDRVVGHIY